MNNLKNRFDRLTSTPFSGVWMVMIAAGGLSLKAIFVKLAYSLDGDLDAIGLLLPRMVLALPFFAIALLWSEYRATLPVQMRDRIAALGLGVLGYYMAAFLDFSGLSYIPASLERLILYLYPTLVVLLLAAARRQAISRHTGGALLLSYAGIALVFQGELSLVAPDIRLGSVLVFASALCFALFMIAGAALIHRLGTVRFTALSMVAATVATAVHHGIGGGAPLATLSTPVWGIALLMALFSTVAPAFLLNAGLRRIGPGAAAIVTTTGPVATLFFAWWLLDERLTLLQLCGALLIVSGVVWVGKLARRGEQ